MVQSCLLIGFFLLIAIPAPRTTAQKQADGPVVVSMGDVFERGATKIEDVNPATLPTHQTLLGEATEIQDNRF